MIGKGLLKREHLILGFPILLVVLVFWQVHRFDSILYDDPSYLYENPIVSSGLSLRGMEWAFTEAGATNLWHPVTWISLMLDVEVFGLANVGAHHLINVAFHLVAVALFYFIFLHYFKNPWLALFFCCLWAIHPHRTQNVAWISERKDVLCMAFMAGAWLAWLKSSRSFRSLLVWFSLVLFALSVMSKPSSVGLPVVLLVSELLSRGPHTRRAVLILGVYLAVSLAAALLALYFQGQGNLASLDQASSLATRVSQLPYTLWWYLESSFFSKGALWVYPPADRWNLFIKPALGLSAFLILLFRFRRDSLVLLGGVAVVCFWLPVSGITSVSYYQVAERYSYFIQIGFVLMGGALVAALLQKYPSRKFAQVLLVVGCGIIVASAGLTYQRTSYWQNSESLFRREAAVNPRSLLAQVFLGIIEKREERWPEALGHFVQALERDGESGLAATHAADCLQALGEKGRAEDYYRKAIAAKVLNTGAPFQALSSLLYQEGRIAEAKEVMLLGIRRFPSEPVLHLDLAALYFRNERDFAKAQRHYDLVILYAPQILEGKLGKALCLIELGNRKQGLELIEELKKQDPERFGSLSF